MLICANHGAEPSKLAQNHLLVSPLKIAAYLGFGIHQKQHGAEDADGESL